MNLREARSAIAPSTRWGALALIASASLGAVVAGLPTLTMQVVLVLGAAVSTVTVMFARAGAVLNPAWIIVAWLYLIEPIAWVLYQIGRGWSPAAVLLLAPSPFVLTALLRRPETRDRLLLLAPLILLALLGGLSVAWSSESTFGISKLSVWILAGLLPAASILVLAPGSPDVAWKWIAAAAFISAIALIFLGADTSQAPGRLTLLNANPIWAARAAFVGALVVLFGPFPRVAKLSMTPVIVVAGLLTVSLGPAVGLAVGAWAGAAEKLRCADRTDRRIAFGWAGLGLIGGLAVVVVVTGVLAPGSSAIARLVVDDPNVTSRASFLGAAASLFLQSPVFGVGIGGFAASGLALYPHNMIAEIAVELGSIGILLFLAWFILALRGAARSPLLVALVVATSVYALFSGSLAGNAEFWMFSALAVAKFPISNNRRTQETLAVEHG